MPNPMTTKPETALNLLQSGVSSLRRIRSSLSGAPDACQGYRQRCMARPAGPELMAVARSPEHPRPARWCSRIGGHFQIDPVPQRLRLDPQRLRLDPQRLRLDPQRLRLDPQRLRLDPQRPRLNPQRLRLNPQRLRLNPQRLRLDPQRLRLDPQRLFYGAAP